MQLREVAREALRDITSGAGRAGSLAMLFAVLLSSTAPLRTIELIADVRSANEFVASGAATTVQTADGRIDGRICDSLTTIPAVRAAGALRRLTDGTTPSVLPGTSIPTFAVTRGLLDVLGVQGTRGTAGVVVPDAVADDLGVGVGSELRATGASTWITGTYTYPDDGRDPDLEYALLEPAVDDGSAFDACWVTVWPTDDEVLPALRGTVLPSTGTDEEARPTVGQLNPRLGTTYTRRSAETNWVALSLAAIAGLTVGAAAVIRRRLSIASDRHIGVPMSAQMLGVALQHTIWASVGAAIGVAVSLVLLRAVVTSDAVPIATEALSICVVGSACSVIGGIIGVSGVRERALHRYFRQR